MERIITDGIIYKVSKYADNSAIASAYTLEYGKIKLFISKAFSKKGGLYTLIPGEIDFLKKDSSDLNKLYSFRPYADYTEYTSNPKITLRLSLFFDIYDKFYGLEQQDKVFWTIINRYKTSDYSKINLFGIYAVLKNTGHFFNINQCAGCDENLDNKSEIFLHNNLCFCSNCKPESAYLIDEYSHLILKSFSKPQLYSSININIRQEITLIDIFSRHIEDILDIKLKSSRLFREMVLSLS